MSGSPALAEPCDNVYSVDRDRKDRPVAGPLVFPDYFSPDHCSVAHGRSAEDLPRPSQASRSDDRGRAAPMDARPVVGRGPEAARKPPGADQRQSLHGCRAADAIDRRGQGPAPSDRRAAPARRRADPPPRQPGGRGGEAGGHDVHATLGGTLLAGAAANRSSLRSTSSCRPSSPGSTGASGRRRASRRRSGPYTGWTARRAA